MRTHTIATALIVALAACGGDGGLSLTEPGQIDLEACSATPTDYTGRWVIGEWGCVGQSSAAGAVNCNPDALPWRNGAEIVVSGSGSSVTATIDGIAIGMDDLEGYLVSDGSRPHVGITGCTDGSALIIVDVPLPDPSVNVDTFAAYAHR